MLQFFLAICLLLITPGPGVLTTAGVGAAYGFRPGLWYMLGIIAGAQVVLLLVVSGLWAAIATVPYVRTILLAASTSYLLYLALKIAIAGSRIAFIEATKPPRFIDGFLLAIVNPKGYAVGTVIFSGFNFMPENLMLENAIKFAIQLVVSFPVHLAWLSAGASIKSLDLKPATMRTINIAMAIGLVAVVVLAVLSESGFAIV
ncbi:MAG: LysE family translocator [Pseudomonadota bacterium]